MNKKVSTIFAMAALMGGVFCSSAYAEEIDRYLGDDATKVESTPYFLKIGTGDTYLGSDFTNDAKTEFEYFTLDKGVDDADLTKETLSKYLWTVSANSQAGQRIAYTFTNALTKQQIRFDVRSGFSLITKTNPGDIAMESLFYAATNVGDTKVEKEYKGGATTFKIAGYDNDDLLAFNNATDDALTPVTEGALEIAATGNEITLVGLADGVQIDISDLNDLYNTAGFNFELKGDDLSSVTNIFGDKKVVALNVGTSAVNANGEGFPAGTYFATLVPWMKTNGAVINDYDYLVQCTFIAVDSDNNIADDADVQKTGEGFTLTEVSGKDLVLYLGNDEDYKAKGNQISVYNACFSVLESTTEEDVFALSVKNVRYVEAANADKQVEKANLAINATEDYAEIVTVPESNNFIFEFTESSAVKPIDLLYKGDTASIYNIRLYKANGADDTRNGKYLTTNATGSAFIAKGKVLADLDAPVYQWVISKVDGSDITFTNRETGKTLTTQLFEEGNGIYSMQEKVDGTPSTYTFYNLEDDGDVEIGDENGKRTFNFDYSTKIQLEKVAKVNNYAGYLNVDDETVLTLSFGRDIAPTSNKLYPVYDEENYRFADELSGDVANAAQWQLIKSKGGNANHPLKYNYVYANGNLINTKNQGDVVYAYTYNLQLVDDGKAVEDAFLYINSSDIAEISFTNATEFYIQENVDGSVNLKVKGSSNDRDLSQALYLQSYNMFTGGSANYSIDQLRGKSMEMQSILVESKATDVKTFLIAEAPAISLPANEGHYSFVSETGNYITKDENRDAFAAREESEAMYLYVTDKEEVVPSFYVTLGTGEAEGERMFLSCPQDSVDYYVANGIYNKQYQWDEEETKAIFKSAAINETRDTLTTSIKGEATLVASEANNTEKVEGGIERFKMQIVEAQDADDMYVVRQVGGQWLKSINGKLAWGNKTDAIKFEITGAEAPTANEGVSATEVKVVAYDGAINIKNAAGKNVVISTILGQIVANEVLTSDNATISVPAGIAIVSVDGEEAVKVSVR